MELRFISMAWYFDILSFVFLGTILAVVLGFLPAFAWSDSVVGRIPNLLSDKVAEWFWFSLTIIAIVGGYVFSFAILAGWVD